MFVPLAQFRVGSPSCQDLIFYMPKKLSKTKKPSHYMGLVISEEMNSQILRLQRKWKLKSKGEAIRRLVQVGITQERFSDN